MTGASEIGVGPVPVELGIAEIEDELLELRNLRPISFRDLTSAATRMNLSAPALSVLLETVELRLRGTIDMTPQKVWTKAADKYINVMQRAVRLGSSSANPTTFVRGDWAKTLSEQGRTSLLGNGWWAFVFAMGVQEFNAGMGLVSAAPTGGASGTVPGTIVAVSEALENSVSQQVESLLVAGLVGRVAFGRGPVSGAQAGCGGEVGVAACMAAGAVVHLLGGSWPEIDAAAGLAGSAFVGLDCSPAFGLVEYPCIPRNGFAALSAIAASEAACAGLVPPYGLDDTLDRIFGVGRLLPESLRETNNGAWAAPACQDNECNQCKSTGRSKVHVGLPAVRESA